MKALLSVFNTVIKESPILFFIVRISFLGALLCIPAYFLDDRELMGINVWLKPMKFFISTGIYTLTLGFYITFYPYKNLKKHIVRNIVSWTLLLEVVIVAFQGARGVQSHYNQSSLFDGILFGIMGILIAINVLIMLLFIIDTIRLKLKVSKAIQWAILLGWIIVFFGSWIGGQMISQMAHNVGVPDGGEGLPFVNWSTIAGDLRVAHFFGLHGLQIVPLFAYILYKKWSASDKKQIILVTIFGLLYAAFIAYTFYQANQGLPLMN